MFACCRDSENDGAQKLKSLGGNTNRLKVVQMDVTKQEQVDEAFRFIEMNLPEYGLWAIVNNAGLGNVGLIEWMPNEIFEKVRQNTPSII